VLVTPSTVYVWQGLGANADELTVATSVASTLAGCYLDTAGREVIQCKEGSEDPEFWNAIGGKQEYVHKPVFMPTCTFSRCFFLLYSDVLLPFRVDRYPSMSPGEPAPRDARLFSASTATGSFKVEEVGYVA
jgi:hypothetical protein